MSTANVNASNNGGASLLEMMRGLDGQAAGGDGQAKIILAELKKAHPGLAQQLPKVPQVQQPPAKTTTTAPTKTSAASQSIQPKTAPAATMPDYSKYPAELRAEMESLWLENQRLKASKTAARVTLKVSEKGALSVYGMGRFPVTLYREQWERLLSCKDDIETFILAHMSELKSKGE